MHSTIPCISLREPSTSPTLRRRSRRWVFGFSPTYFRFPDLMESKMMVWCESETLISSIFICKCGPMSRCCELFMAPRQLLRVWMIRMMKMWVISTLSAFQNWVNPTNFSPQVAGTPALMTSRTQMPSSLLVSSGWSDWTRTRIRSSRAFLWWRRSTRRFDSLVQAQTENRFCFIASL